MARLISGSFSSFTFASDTPDNLKSALAASINPSISLSKALLVIRSANLTSSSSAIYATALLSFFLNENYAVWISQFAIGNHRSLRNPLIGVFVEIATVSDGHVAVDHVVAQPHQDADHFASVRLVDGR